MKAFAAAIIIALVGLLLVGIQQSRVVALRGEVAFEASEKKKAVDANLESQATITTLRAEAQRNADYQKDLNKRLQASQAINLLDTCADQVDAQIKRSQSK